MIRRRSVFCRESSSTQIPQEKKIELSKGNTDAHNCAYSSVNVILTPIGKTRLKFGAVRCHLKRWSNKALFIISELCCSMYCFVSTVLFCVLFECKCVLYHCHRMSTQLQLNISSSSITGLDRPRGFQKVKAPRFLHNRQMKVVRLSALHTGRL
jgi:hypothetical protein